MTSEADRQVLLRIARDAVVAHVSAVRSVDSAGHEGSVAMVGVAVRPGAAFVTIHRQANFGAASDVWRLTNRSVA